MNGSISEGMWKAIAESPVLMVRLTASRDHALSMAAQLDQQASGKFWFYTTRTNRMAEGGRATAQFASIGHDLSCSISDILVEEQNPAVVDRHWSKAVEAWYEQGRADPQILMMRFELADAETWTRDNNIVGLFKLMSGKKDKDGELGEHGRVQL